jgi:hypothetical protein
MSSWAILHSGIHIYEVYTLAKQDYSMPPHYNSLSTKTCSVCRRNRWPFPPMSIRHLQDHNKSARTVQRMSWSNTSHCPIFHLSKIHRVFACKMLQDSFRMCPTRETSSDRLCIQFLDGYKDGWTFSLSHIKLFHDAKLVNRSGLLKKWYLVISEFLNQEGKVILYENFLLFLFY